MVITIIKKTILIVLLCMSNLFSYDLNITQNSSFLEENSKNLFLILETMNSIEVSKKEYEEISKSNIVTFNDGNTTFNKVFDMDRYFKKIKHYGCSLTYKYKQKHYFIFNCKDKKIDKVYTFKKDSLKIFIEALNGGILDVDSLKSIELFIKRFSCGDSISYFGRHITYCYLFLK